MGILGKPATQYSRFEGAAYYHSLHSIFRAEHGLAASSGDDDDQDDEDAMAHIEEMDEDEFIAEMGEGDEGDAEEGDEEENTEANAAAQVAVEARAHPWAGLLVRPASVATTRSSGMRLRSQDVEVVESENDSDDSEVEVEISEDPRV
jgi:hypothetical protein